MEYYTARKKNEKDLQVQNGKNLQDTLVIWKEQTE